ncbi:MAG: ribosome biogenesis GTPase Der [Candidatus Caenarcaniphilales bacterium]|nr:ribosome biogenesis GTPase Der [Candidatus Caenarcaniphilales bacterium]
MDKKINRKNKSAKKALKIAIVGAPNVGKSTLFNKLIGGRRSIVKDLPGVTRDRIYADVNLAKWTDEIDNLPVQIIDTGGLFFKEDTLFKGVQKQAELSLEEADCILFMVDARTGINNTDRKIAKLVRKQQKPIFLLANKIDSKEIEHLNADFYNLGMGDPISFSSIGGTFKKSINTLLNKVIESGVANEHINQKAINEEELLKIVIIGRPNVGKSSLLNKIVGYERSLVHDEAGTTRDALDTQFTFNKKKILLIDTAGLRRKSKVYGELERFSVDRTIKGLVRADIAVLVLDATEGVNNQEKKLASLIQKRHRACVIVLNKWDLIEKDNKTFEDYSRAIKYQLGFVEYAPLVITSALSGQRVKDILEECLKVYENYQRRVPTGVFNQVLREVVAINEPAKAGAKNCKIYYGTQVENKPPTFALFVNDPKRISKNYLKFLEKSMRNEFELNGTPLDWIIKKSTGKLDK